jgi:hypothetical protein
VYPLYISVLVAHYITNFAPCHGGRRKRLEENDRNKMMGLRGTHFVGSMEIAIPGGVACRSRLKGCLCRSSFSSMADNNFENLFF